MKRLYFFILILGLSTTTFAGITSDFSDEINFIENDFKQANDVEQNTFSDITLENDLDNWCCYEMVTETRVIGACSDQGCQAAFEIFWQMLSW